MTTISDIYSNTDWVQVNTGIIQLTILAPLGTYNIEVRGSLSTLQNTTIRYKLIGHYCDIDASPNLPPVFNTGITALPD
jgi:hypothetical protein